MKRIALILTLIVPLMMVPSCIGGDLDPDGTEKIDQGGENGSGEEGGGSPEQGESGSGEQGSGQEGGGSEQGGGQEGGSGEEGTGSGDEGGSGSGQQGGGSQTLELITVYSESFDGGATGSVSSVSGWQKTSGNGAASVAYTGTEATVRNDNYGSTGRNNTYDGASGGGYIRLAHWSSTNTYGVLTVSGISACSRTDFKFEMGVTQGKNVMKIEVSADGVSWKELDYAFNGTYDYWEKTSGSFTLPSGTASFSLRLTLLGSYSDYRYGANVDDILITSGDDTSGGSGQGGSGQGGGQSGTINKYVENPAPSSNSDWYSSTLYSTTVNSGKKVRNYSFCYDTRRHNPIWVAFPMHAIYAEGRGGRTTPDPWQKYPDLPVEKQSIIWNIENSGYQYWSYSATQSQGKSWTKGHLCMSASRGGADTELNIQTFYPVNIAPQINSKTAPMFATLWSKTENYHYYGASEICSDTLYVVCGCHYGDETWIEYDACDWNTHSQWSKQCVFPSHQYKILLRTRNGNSGKRVQDCAASELKAIGFWFDSIICDDASEDLKDYAVSIAEIERRTGLTFFPAVTSAVKSQCTPSDWGR